MGRDMGELIPTPKMTVDHACLACGAVHDGARVVQLHDGRSVSNYSEEWQHESEAAAILEFRNLAKRNEHLRRLEGHRGKPAAEKLRATMAAIAKAREANEQRDSEQRESV